MVLVCCYLLAQGSADEARLSTACTSDVSWTRWPFEVALLLFVIVRWHLQVPQLGLAEAYPAEELWFTVQQGV